VATLYFAQGLPNAVVDLVAPVAMKDLGFDNAVITTVAAWAYLPWTLKALWSPLVDGLGRKRTWVFGMQAAGALLLGALAAAFFCGVPALGIVVALGAIAVVSATHDIAADGRSIPGGKRFTPAGAARFFGFRKFSPKAA